MDKYKKLFSNTLIFGIGTFSSKILVLLMTRLYTQYMTPADYGAVNLVIQAGNLLLPLATVGITNGIIRFGLDKAVNKADVFTTGILTFICGYGMLLLFEPLLTKIPYFEGRIWMVYLFLFTSSLRSLCSQFVRSRQLIRLYALDGILSTITTILFTVLFLVSLDMGITGYMLAIILSDALSALFLFFTASLHRYFRITRLNTGVTGAMLRYSVPLIPTTIFWWITNTSDHYIVTHILGDAANGLYVAAYKIPTIIVLVSTIFMDAWQVSAVTENDNIDKERYGRFFTRIFTAYQAAIFVVSAGLILFAKVIIKILAAQSYYDAWRYIPILLIATDFSCMVTFTGSIYMVEKRSVFTLVTTLLGAVINVVLNLLLIPQLGVNGAALATFVSYFVVFVIRAIHTRKIIRINWQPVRLTVNTLILAVQSVVILYSFQGWVYVEILLTAVMLVLNMGPLLATVQKIFKKAKRA